MFLVCYRRNNVRILGCCKLFSAFVTVVLLSDHFVVLKIKNWAIIFSCSQFMINGQCLLMACVVFTSFGKLGYVSVFAKKVLCMVIIGCCRECSYLLMYDGFLGGFLQSKLCLTFLWHVNMDHVYCNWLVQSGLLLVQCFLHGYCHFGYNVYVQGQLVIVKWTILDYSALVRYFV